MVGAARFRVEVRIRFNGGASTRSDTPTAECRSGAMGLDGRWSNVLRGAPAMPMPPTRCL